ncbi:NAD(P)/FAD-dependent oxidoreductase [Streptomyces alkaliterrae]|uniref:Oxidoreductase n=1 Tax=Streptomyces alkaliterrae TaxID=2213162 RepID=A0A5P0YP94_9ACTN|nr:FAD-dependent oxidoreductase [Streptomyces alkaliterrae]MBB1253153.1 oxidoreductase [Streptomyces alkaliterrae]MBB1259342.1 oxidoreductase [Streptomyces alkaliterrae]MQS01720.1 NAD(P)/FAD-dependent oxidoreductase [Streptomyces alkaliterrae]
MTPQSAQTAEPHALIVGAGLAGVQTAVQLREAGWTGRVTVVGAEAHPPYDRPPLSKAVLTGKAEGSTFEVDFAALEVEIHLGREVTALRPDRRVVETDAGEVPYDRLVIATGSEPLLLPGSEGVPGVHLLRTLDDARALRPVLAEARPVVAVGAGWIGAEFTTAARETGCPVTVVEAGGQPLAGALPADVAAPMRQWYAEAGAELRTGVAVTAVRPGEVELADGTVLPADAVVVGIGSRPATGWLAGSGVELGEDGAVLVDEWLRTSVPDVYAVGDCASFPSRRYGRRLLVHHWDNALQGPRSVALGLVGGDSGQAVDSAVEPYDPVPYFWSEQFGRFVQFAGQPGEGEELLWRGDPGGASWSVCWLREGRLTALLAVGRPRDLAQGRRLIERGAGLDRRLAEDPAVPLKKAASAAGSV